MEASSERAAILRDGRMQACDLLRMRPEWRLKPFKKNPPPGRTFWGRVGEPCRGLAPEGKAGWQGGGWLGGLLDLGAAELFGDGPLEDVHALVELTVSGGERHHALDHLVVGTSALDD